MPRQRTRTVLLQMLVMGAPVLLAGASKPPAAPKALQPKGSCAVCGMHVANFPDWAAAVTFKDGGQAWFDGPKDLFTYLLDLKRYAPRRSAGDVAGILVRDYYGLKHIDGRTAFYVLGSDVLGPMGKELVPFATEAGARDFLKDHKGQKVIAFGDINIGTMKLLE